MAEVINATCSICGKGYYLCQSCNDFKTLYPYKLHTDTSEHYKVYQIIHGYSTKVYDKSEAKKKLQTIDLSDLDTFRDNIKAIIKDILNSDEDKVDIKIEDKIVADKIKTAKKKSSKIVKI